MTKADLIRKKLITNILTEGQQMNNRINLKIDGDTGLYNEILTINEITEVTDNFKTHSNINSYLNEFIFERLNGILENFGYEVYLYFDNRGKDNNTGFGKLFSKIISTWYYCVFNICNSWCDWDS